MASTTVTGANIVGSIERPDAEEQRLDQAAAHRSQHESNGGSGTDDAKRIGQHEPEDIGGRRPERPADADRSQSVNG